MPVCCNVHPSTLLAALPSIAAALAAVHTLSKAKTKRRWRCQTRWQSPSVTSALELKFSSSARGKESRWNRVAVQNTNKAGGPERSGTGTAFQDQVSAVAQNRHKPVKINARLLRCYACVCLFTLADGGN